MIGSGGAVGGGGGSFDPSALAGYASQAWVEDNYISKLFFGRMFTANGTKKVYTSTDGGTTWGDPVTTAVTIAPNEIMPSEEIVDGETSGTKIKTVRELSSIQALVGLWTQQYLSALGQNSSGGGGGGGSSTLAGLLDVNIPSPMTQSNDGQVLMYNYIQNKWINANLPPTGVTSVGMTVPTGFSVSPATITSNGTFAITFASGYSLPLTADVSKGVTAYGWGNHASAGYATQTWVGQQGFALESNVYSKADADAKFMTIAAFENLFNAIASDGSTKVNHPYATNVASIKAMFGLWTNQYLSALGLNSSGGGGGASTLAGLNDVQLGTLSDGQILTYSTTLDERGHDCAYWVLSKPSDNHVIRHVCYHPCQWVFTPDNGKAGKLGCSLYRQAYALKQVGARRYHFYGRIALGHRLRMGRPRPGGIRFGSECLLEDGGRCEVYDHCSLRESVQCSRQQQSEGEPSVLIRRG